LVRYFHNTDIIYFLSKRCRHQSPCLGYDSDKAIAHKGLQTSL